MKLLRFFLYLPAMAALGLAVGCASSAKNVPVEAPPPPVIEAPAEVAVAPPAVEEPPAAEPEATAPVLPDDGPVDVGLLLESARALCAESRFAAADTLLKRVSAFLMRHNIDEDNRDLLQEYIAEIISIYAEFMPPEFSTPEEISVLIFKQNILESLMDSLRISPDDSVFLARFSNKRGVIYDVPMVWNDRVKKALLFYTRTRKGVFDRWLNRAGYYLPVMRQMFADAGLPQDLAYLPIIESGFNPHAYSRAHAAGIWQFIPSTGRNYGLRQNYWIDERRDPLKSTEGAIGYLRKLYGDFGNWHIALASYNCGENGMARSIRRANNLYDYWGLTLPKETMNYVPLYLASIMIAKNPDVFNFTLQDSLKFDRDTVFINDCLEMATIAQGIDVPLDTLSKINPHILHWCTPPDMENVRLYLPAGYADAFRKFYSELPDEKKTKFYRYKVQGSDNLLQIARNFKTPVDALREINKMKGNSISVGQHIIIPMPVGESVPANLLAHVNASERPGRQSGGTVTSRSGRKLTYRVRTGETVYSIASRFGVSPKDLMAWNYIGNPRHLKAGQSLVIHMKEAAPQRPSAPRVAVAATGGASSSHTGKHLVRQGETLYGISQAVGVPVSELARINGLDPRRPLIYPGDVLVYTPKAAAAPQPAPAAPQPPAGERQ